MIQLDENWWWLGTEEELQAAVEYAEQHPDTLFGIPIVYDMPQDVEL